MDKRSSLLRKFVNYGEKKFYNIGRLLVYPRILDYTHNYELITAVKSFTSQAPGMETSGSELIPAVKVL